ncbi:MAG: N-formylglutamate amidohydrolase [Ramlibacter sp.]|nr:N-formylglutamate amidohydrolase [Ramlibacter sp.]
MDAPIPLVVDSPHSSPRLPPDADCIAPQAALRSSWDAHVDELWRDVPSVGGYLLCANFHRAYIDPNRSALDIDPDMLASPWPTLTQLSAAGRRGMGLIRRYALPGVSMYSRKLLPHEVAARLDRFYHPYHAQLEALIDRAVATHGRSWHVNCHSMKSTGNAMNSDAGHLRPDLVISDGQGVTADPAFTCWVANWWRQAGYLASINHPYEGGEIVRRFGRPARGRQSIQIEIRRDLYMDEATCEKTPGFGALSADVRRFLGDLRSDILAQLAAAARNERLEAGVDRR